MRGCSRQRCCNSPEWKPPRWPSAMNERQGRPVHTVDRYSALRRDGALVHAAARGAQGKEPVQSATRVCRAFVYTRLYDRPTGLERRQMRGCQGLGAGE